MKIPDAAVEAAARAAYEEGFLRHVRRTRLGFTWDDISDEARESWRQVVIAAAPHLIEVTEVAEVAVRERVARNIEAARSQAPAWVAESHLPAWEAALAHAARIANGEQP